MAEGGRLDLAGLVTRRVPLDEADAALDAIEGGEVIRSVLIMEEP
jgi:Zn-dependent alcohol dehydrogenase